MLTPEDLKFLDRTSHLAKTTDRTQSQSTLGDIPKFLERGARQFVGSLGTIPEAAGALTGIRGLENAGQRFRQSQDKVIREQIDPSLSETGQKVAKSGFVDDVVMGDTPLAPFLVGKTFETLPAMLAGGAAGAGIKATTKLSTGKSFAAGEAAVTIPMGAAEQARSIDDRSTADLLQTSDHFRAAYQKHAGLPDAERDAAARSDIKAMALPAGGLAAGTATLAGSALAGKFIKGGTGGVFDDAGEAAQGIIQHIGQGGKREAVQEAAQSALESVAQNLTTGEFVDPAAREIDNLMVDALKSAAEGAVLGSTTGGTIGAVQGVINKSAKKRFDEAIADDPTEPAPPKPNPSGPASPSATSAESPSTSPSGALPNKQPVDDLGGAGTERFSPKEFVKGGITAERIIQLSKSELNALGQQFGANVNFMTLANARQRVMDVATQKSNLEQALSATAKNEPEVNVEQALADQAQMEEGNFTIDDLMARGKTSRQNIAQNFNINIEGMGKVKASERIANALQSRRENVAAPYELINDAIETTGAKITGAQRSFLEQALSDPDPEVRASTVQNLINEEFGRRTEAVDIVTALSDRLNADLGTAQAQAEVDANRPDVLNTTELPTTNPKIDTLSNPRAVAPEQTPADTELAPGNVVAEPDLEALLQSPADDIAKRVADKFSLGLTAEIQQKSAAQLLEKTQGGIGGNLPSVDILRRDTQLTQLAQPESNIAPNLSKERTELPPFEALTRDTTPLPSNSAPSSAVSQDNPVQALPLTGSGLPRDATPIPTEALLTRLQGERVDQRLSDQQGNVAAASATSTKAETDRVGKADNIQNPGEIVTPDVKEKQSKSKKKLTQVSETGFNGTQVDNDLDHNTLTTVEFGRINLTPAGLNKQRRKVLVKAAELLGIRHKGVNMKNITQSLLDFGKASNTIQGRAFQDFFENGAVIQSPVGFTPERKLMLQAKKDAAKNDAAKTPKADKPPRTEIPPKRESEDIETAVVDATAAFDKDVVLPEHVVELRIAQLQEQMTPDQMDYLVTKMGQRPQVVSDNLIRAAEQKLTVEQLIANVKQAFKNMQSANAFHDTEDAIMSMNDSDLPSVLDDYFALNVEDIADYDLSNLPDEAAGSGINGLRASFVGRRAIGADLDRRNDAINRLLKGESRENVRMATGWFQGGDGQMRFELDDTVSDIRTLLLSDQAPDSFLLDELLIHQNLFEAYPHLRSFTVIRESNMGNAAASYNPITETIKISKDIYNANTIKTPEQRKELKKTILHEIQHGIQAFEDFARGGAPSGILETKEFQDYIDNLNSQLDTPLKPDTVHREARRVYMLLYGEQEARETEARLDFSTFERHMIQPTHVKKGGEATFLNAGKLMNEFVSSRRRQVEGALRHLQRKGNFKINVITNELQLPEAGRKYVADNNLQGLRGLFIQGATSAQDQIYVIADNITTPQEAVFVALHEAVHRGLRKTFGADLSKVLLQIHNTNRNVRNLVKDRLAVNPNMGKLEATEEVLADMAKEGTAPHLKLWNKLVDFIKNWLHKKGFADFTVTDKMVADIVAGAQRAGMEADVQAFGTAQFNPESMDIRASQNPNQSPTGLFDRVDGLLSSVKKFAETSSPAVTGFLHRKNLYFSTASHIARFYGRKLGGNIQRILESFQSSNGRVSAMVAKMDKDISQNVRRIDTLDAKQQNTLYELMGESTRLGMYPNRPFDQQPWLDKDPETKSTYNRLRALYQKPGIKPVYDELLAHTRRDFDLTFGTLLRNLASVYDVPQDIWQELDPLYALSESAATRKRFYDALNSVQEWFNTNGSEDARNAVASMANFRTQRLQGPYFHLGRYGSHFTRFKVAKGSEAEVRRRLDESGLTEAAYISEDASNIMLRFETESNWLAMKKLLDQFNESGLVEGLTVGKLEENISELDGSSPTFVQNMLSRIDADFRVPAEDRERTKELVRRTFVEMMPEITGSRAMARRKGTPGYSLNMRRSFVKKSRAVTFFVAHTTVRPDMLNSMKAMRSEIRAMETDPEEDPRKTALTVDVFNHIKQRQENSLNPIHSPTEDTFSALGYTMFLASNIPYILSNLAQPFQVTLPVVGGRYGFAKTAGAMFRAGQMAGQILKDTIQQGKVDGKGWTGVLDAHIVVKRSNMTADQKQAMGALIDSGLIEFTQAHGLGRIESGGNEKLGTLAKAAGALSHFSEALNRITAGMAAFDLENERLLADRSISDKDRLKRATDYAREVVDRTQFNYDPENRGYAFSKRGIFGRMTPLFTAFQQFNMQMLQLLTDLTTQSFSNSKTEAAAARKALAGIMATSTALAGVMGLPFATVVAAVYNGLGDDDEPRDMRLDVQNWMAGVFGADASQMITHGPLDRVSGGTFSTRLSLGDIVPFSKFLADRRELSDKIGDGALGLLGPSIGAGVNIAAGANKLIDGDVFKAMTLMLPAALQGPVKGVDLVSNGYSDYHGNKIPIEASGWDTFLQFLNITPAAKTELQRNSSSFKAIDREIKSRKQDLGRDMVDAMMKNDHERVREIGAEITKFLQTNPDAGRIDLESIAKGRQKQLQTAVATQTGVQTRNADLTRLMELLQGSTSTALRERLNGV